MTKERLYLFDTTLRDGAQTYGISFSLEEKRAICALLERLGVDYIEGGWPGSNPTDTAFFSQNPCKRSTFTAFGMTKRMDRSISNDAGLNDVINSAAEAVCLVCKSWDFHVKVALGVTLEENLSALAQSVKAIVATGKEAMIDCEHFFDGYKANPEYALEVANTAFKAGARWVVLCDTNGGCMPFEIADIVNRVKEYIPPEHLGIHCHDDTGQAVANTLAAVDAGVRQIQGTLNGLGERCGNANLVSIISTLMLKPHYTSQFTTGITTETLTEIKSISHSFDEMINRAPNPHAPYVGINAFAHKGGLHGSAIAKDPTTYEHVNPESVGNERSLLVSDMAGRANVLQKLAKLGIALEKDDPRVARLLSRLKEKESQGYSYEAADASFKVLALDSMNKIPAWFHVDGFRVIVERRHNALAELVTVSEATVKVVVHGETLISAAEGNGPVNALDVALRKDLGAYSDYIKDLSLFDFKVRILNSGTSATTRVLIESGDRQERWWTVGVSSNIVDASFQAMIDSIHYKLHKEKAPASF